MEEDGYRTVALSAEYFQDSYTSKEIKTKMMQVVDLEGNGSDTLLWLRYCWKRPSFQMLVVSEDDTVDMFKLGSPKTLQEA